MTAPFLNLKRREKCPLLFGCEAAELAALDFIQQNFRSGFGDSLMVFMSTIGNAGILWIVAAVIMLCTKKYRRSGLILTAGLLLGLIFGNIILKNVIARPRPCWINDEVAIIIPRPSDFSFPSGHTLASFVSAFILLKTNRRIGFIALAAAILIAFSRMYLYVHFPTDILGGIALAFLIYILLKKFLIADKETD